MAMFRPNIQRLEATGNISGLVRAASHQDPGIRREAVRALGRFRDREVYGPLVHALKDAHGSVRMEAIHALGTIRDPAFAASLQICLKDPDPSIRIQAVRVLCHLGGPDVIKPLILSMADSEKEVRVNAVEAVTSLGELALPELRKAIRGRNQLVRQNVLNVLAGLKRADFLHDIIEAVEDPVTTVRENAIWALGVIGDPAAVPCLEKNDSSRARRSLKQIREGQNWRTVAVNYEKAGRYEDAAAVYEMKGEWEEAGRLRKLTREASSPYSIPQILANSLNFSHETIIRDSVINRSNLGKGDHIHDGVVHGHGVGTGGPGRDRTTSVVPDGGPSMGIPPNVSNAGGRTGVSDGDGPSGVPKIWRPSRVSDAGCQSGASDAVSPPPAPTVRVIPDGQDVGPDRERSSAPSGTRPQREHPGTDTEGRTGDVFRICPFCGRELTFARTPVYCPYCAEQLRSPYP